jgi:hypothetical protein
LVRYLLHSCSLSIYTNYYTGRFEFQRTNHEDDLGSRTLTNDIEKPILRFADHARYLRQVFDIQCNAKLNLEPVFSLTKTE